MKIPKNEWLTYYEVTFNNADNKLTTVGGFFNAADYADAAALLEDCFRDDLISIDKIEMFDTDMLILSADIARGAKRNFIEVN